MAGREAVRGRFARLRPLLFAPPVLIAAALLAWAMTSRQPPEMLAPQETATPVRVLTLAPQAFTPRVVGHGVVASSRVWTASAQVAGRIAALGPDFRRGGWVRAGDELAAIAPHDYRIALAQAEAQRAAIDARLAELALGVENAAASLAIEREALALSERELARQRDLVARGAAPAATLEAQERQALTQRARAQDLSNQIALYPDQRRALEQEGVAADATLERARLDLARTVIRAPFDARVTAVDVEQDQFVGVGGVLGRIDGADEAEIDVQLPQARMRDFVRAVFGADAANDPEALSEASRRARLSAVARLRFDAETVTWTGAVSRASPAVDPDTRAFGAIVTIADPFRADPRSGRPPLGRGLFLEVDLVGPPIERALVAPRAAIRSGAVFVADGQDRLRRRPVTVAMTVDGVALIAAGVAAGERVVLSDLPAAVEGMLLTPVEDDAAAARVTAAAAGGAR